MYCRTNFRPKYHPQLDLLSFTQLLRPYIIYTYIVLEIMDIPFSEKSAKSETRNFWITFLMFFLEMPLQKNVKSHVSFGFSKKT